MRSIQTVNMVIIFCIYLGCESESNLIIIGLSNKQTLKQQLAFDYI